LHPKRASKKEKQTIIQLYTYPQSLNLKLKAAFLIKIRKCKNQKEKSRRTAFLTFLDVRRDQKVVLYQPPKAQTIIGRWGVLLELL